jgi:CubicO group peptidase (beta-lactamase class C family)
MPDTSAIDGLLERAVEDQVVPGVIAIAGDRDGVVYEGAFGERGGGQPTQPDTMIWIASMTKALVSVAALQLVERGELSLDAAVADILPAFGELQVLEGFEGDTPVLRAPARRATVRELLTHTGGLGYWFCNPDVLHYLQVTGVPDPTTSRLAALVDVPLIADPGTRWEYGTNIDWLGLTIEAITGQDLASYCAEDIFGPLGMVDATFAPSEAQAARMMTVHARTPDGGLVEAPLEFPAEPEFFAGGHGAVATAGDYLRFMRAMLRGGELDGQQVLRPETVELAFTNQLGGLPFPEIVHSAIPELSNDIPSLPFAQGWGFGFHLMLEDIPAMRRAGTGDWAGLANCYYWIDRESGVAGAFLTQVLPFADLRIIETLAGFEQRVYAAVGAAV